MQSGEGACVGMKCPSRQSFPLYTGPCRVGREIDIFSVLRGEFSAAVKSFDGTRSFAVFIQASFSPQKLYLVFLFYSFFQFTGSTRDALAFHPIHGIMGAWLSR